MTHGARRKRAALDALTPEQAEILQQVLTAAPARPDALLPVLQALQARLGYLPEAAFASIGSALELSRAEVHGVVSFYHDFRTTPPAAHRLRLCRAEACLAMGADRLQRELEQALASRPNRGDGPSRVELESVYCLGNCACAPAMTVDGELRGRVSPALCLEWLHRLEAAP